MRIMFCIVIAIPKRMSGKYFLKVSSKSDSAIMSKLQIETLKFVYSSCCFIIPELVLSDQLIPGTHNFRTNLFRPTKFRTNKFPDHLNFGFLTILTELSWWSRHDERSMKCHLHTDIYTLVDRDNELLADHIQVI